LVGLLGPLAAESQGDFALQGDEQLTVDSYHYKGTLYDTSCASIVSGGQVHQLYAYDTSTANISSGSVYSIFTRNFSVVDISGGSTHDLDARNSSVVNISGGSVSWIYGYDSSAVNVSGGSISDLHVYNYSTITLYGQNFRGSSSITFDGRRVLGTGMLSGDWMDGTPWAVNIFENDPTATILVIPVPAIHNITQDTYHETIHEAIDEATAGDTIEVPVGTYTDDSNRDVDFNGKAITLRSENPDDPAIVAATIIDCNGTAEDPHRGFYFHSGEDANSILEGFTITNGYGPNEPFGASTYSAGGAIYCISSSPTIRNCVFANNYSHYWGGGMWFDNSHAVIEDCIFQDNVALDTGGGLYNRSSSITLKHCQFVDNSADYGGGIYTIDGASSVRNTLFIGNLAAINGGALRNKRVASTISNCTFFDNQAPAGAAVHNVLSEGTTITNCILWGNPDTGIEGDAVVSYCDVQAGCPGEGNIDADPCFANVDEDDFHLRSQFGRWEPTSKTWVLDTVTSPCIDRGDPSDPVGDEPNPNRNRINQGAYGGTAEASKSPDCTEALLSDLNHDCRVDFLDFAIFVSQWLECRIEPPDFCWW